MVTLYKESVYCTDMIFLENHWLDSAPTYAFCLYFLGQTVIYWNGWSDEKWKWGEGTRAKEPASINFRGQNHIKWRTRFII